MKAFEEWWNEEQSDEEFELECEEIDSIEGYIERLARVSWRAALEWVLENHVELGMGDRTLIKQELEEVV